MIPKLFLILFSSSCDPLGSCYSIFGMKEAKKEGLHFIYGFRVDEMVNIEESNGSIVAEVSGW